MSRDCRALLDETAIPLIASGGVGTLDHLRVLAAVRSAASEPCPGAIVGRALYDGRFTVTDALAAVRGERLMFVARVIPCLDVDAGRVVKGVNFVGLRDAGDPVELAARYDIEGADELVFLDITASSDARDTMIDVVTRTAEQVFIPFTVGGGIRSVEDARRMLRAGADKVSVNTAAVQRPELIGEIAEEFGAQCVVVAIDAAPQRRWDSKSSRTADAPAPVSMRSSGRHGPRRWVPARSCSRRWTATALAMASTSS